MSIQFLPGITSQLRPDALLDNQYYDEIYAHSDDLFNQAFEEFDKANAASGREAAYQLAMLVAAVGLAFAAYGSLLDEKNRMRPLFALMSLFMLGLSVAQFLSV